jgi:hypothetical protein
MFDEAQAKIGNAVAEALNFTKGGNEVVATV